MIIKKRHIVSWLLEDNYILKPNCIVVNGGMNQEVTQYLHWALSVLNDLKENRVDWGLPEMIMPSFEKVMQKSYDSFAKIDHQLIHELGEDRECGILIDRDEHTVVYGIQDDKITIWLFREIDGISCLLAFYQIVSLEGNKRRLDLFPPLIQDPSVLTGTVQEKQEDLMNLSKMLVTYLAVKKYAEVEVVVIPLGKFTEVEGTPLEYVEKKKVINISGQEVIVMDSRWFRKIINDNDIYVRGFFRMQRKKNPQGEWYKELIFIEPFVRHGYHRDALIGDEDELKEEY